MLKSEDPISQRRKSTQSYTEAFSEDKESKPQEETIKEYLPEQNETNECELPITEKIYKRRSALTKDSGSRSTSVILEIETTLSEEKSNPLLNAASSEAQSQPEGHDFEEIENDGNKGVCCACVPEVFYCVSWYLGNIGNSILACFRRCGACCRSFKSPTLRNAGEPDENCVDFYDHKHAFSTFEDDNNITNCNYGADATFVTSLEGTYKGVSDEVGFIDESELNIIDATDTRLSPTKTCSDLDGGDVYNINKNYTVDDVKPAAIESNSGNNNTEIAYKRSSLTKDCSDIHVKEVHDVIKNHIADEYNPPASFTYDCPVFDSPGGGSNNNTGCGGAFDSGGGNDSMGDF